MAYELNNKGQNVFNMKNKLFFGLIVLILVAFLPGCAVVGGIFKAGAWTGITLVLLVIFLIVYIISKSRGDK